MVKNDPDGGGMMKHDMHSGHDSGAAAQQHQNHTIPHEVHGKDIPELEIELQQT